MNNRYLFPELADEMLKYQFAGEIKTLVEMLGEEQASIFFSEFGGLELYISENIKEAFLQQGLTEQSIHTLLFTYQKMMIKVPKAHDFILHCRNQKIRKDRDSGMKINNIAMKYKLTTRAINNVLAKSRA